MSSDRFTVGPSGRALLADLGVDLAGVLRRARLPTAVYTHGTAELSTAEYYAFWRALDEEAGDPLLPIRIGRAMRAEVFDPPLFAAFCSPDLSVAAARLATYKKLIGPLRLEVGEGGGALTIAMHWPEAETAPAALVLTELIFWVALARIATREEVRPLRFAAPAGTTPGQAAAYRDYLGAPVERSAVATVTFSRADAERPFLTANERMWEYFEPGLRRRLTEFETQPSATELVRQVLLRLLPAGTATLDAVARELAVSARTLQRRLQLEGTAFQDVLRRTREALARHYLSTSRMNPAEIAYLLGYDDTNSFYRAFHGWTGRTPEQFRTVAAAAPGPVG
ncbi:AraC family transcriptional regulator ligand-binding domain-containing protein [Dactylosporangium aurantiacum]|uniref:AraC family transcriptional regulator ligand-binding domain-containing protein n=1 Tax=Dactylosporangium aurantiacum TaxID=35754 RepID=A0A9Q9MLH3_9ACTN|nr:AraC family transcriptional regulator [Dactylosporangium aurantiacum]MDG6103823.1 AraC family transcriptional regulator ligand-binding domain-containing protein [Dactylosporangium aurantiacum]UWZ58975.1 AraC family transcriptional regulator ligand-binding domain-containing protein [Dactylosporangium aurantiacum]